VKQLPTLFVVAIGGALGASCRWALLATFDTVSATTTVFILNIVGSLLLGAIISQRFALEDRSFQFAGAGVVGGFTTFSTFAVDVAQLIDDSQLAAAAVTALVTPFVAVVFAGIGYRIGREIRR